MWQFIQQTSLFIANERARRSYDEICAKLSKSRGSILYPFAQLKKIAQLGPIQEKPGCAENVKKYCANRVIRILEEKLIFTVLQFREETYWVLEKEIAEEETLQHIGLAR